MSRTYQANQKNLEDSNSLKRVQKETANELKMQRQRDEMERRGLEEDLRRQAIESAFQYDMEMAIQRAADGVISQQGTWIQNQQFYNKRIKEFENELQLTKELLAAKEAENVEIKSMVENYQGLLSESNKKLSDLTINHTVTLQQCTSLRNQLSDEVSTRKDLEVERDNV